MALGECTTFEFNRFLKDFKCVDAITVTCETLEESYNFFNFLKASSEFDNCLLPPIGMIEDRFTDSDKWINFYCYGDLGALCCDIVTDEDCEGKSYASDYYYKDIAFVEPVKVSKVDLFDFLKG